MNYFKLNELISVVTGGYGHIGKAIVNCLLDNGAIVIVAGRSQEKFNTVFSNDKTGRIFFVETDITKSTSINNLFTWIESKYGKLDILINNAQSTKGSDILTMSDEDWNYTLDGVLGSVHKCIRASLPLLKKSKAAKIINIASMYGMVSPDFEVYESIEEYTNPPHYGAAKAGIIQLTKYFAGYLGKLKINVNCISPGPFPDNSIVQEYPIFVERLKSKTMLKRIGTPSDICGTILLLSSTASDFITGQNIVIDGGWTSN